MSARKARKLADGSRKEGTLQEESDFSLDNDFSLVENRRHQSRSSVRKSLEQENSSQSSDQANGEQSDEEEGCSQRPARKRKRIVNGNLSNGDLPNGDLSDGDLPNGDLTNGDLTSPKSRSRRKASQTNGKRPIESSDEETDANSDEENEFSQTQFSESQYSQTQFSESQYSQTQLSETQYSQSQYGQTQNGHSQAMIEDDEASQNDEAGDELQPDCGTIESIQLFNFMCHDHFEITLNPRVNFVIGKNGSGKSAILNAIVIVLGGRATNTGRGQSLTSFIKNGKQSAKIIIKLCNYSPYKKKTYKYSEYGKSILVERIIKTDGTSNYILKSALGRVISRKKEELNEIIHLFSIQIENPVCILSQEVSRNFLNSKNARDKYDFFMKATNLEHLRSHYAQALQQSKQTKEILVKKRSFLPAIEKELKELQKKVDVFTRFNRKKDQLADLVAELAWSVVREIEKEEAEPPVAVRALNQKIDEITVRLEKTKEENEELEKVRDEFGTNMQTEFEKEMRELAVRKENLVKRQAELRTSKCEKQLKINELNFSISAENKNKAQLQRKIDDIKEQIAQQEKLIAEQERLKARKIEMQEEEAAIKLTNESLRAEKDAKQEEYTKACDSMKSLNYKLNKLRSDLTNKDNLLKNLKGSTKDSLAKFGQPYVRLVKAIEDEHRKGRFKAKPIGPLGYYIKLKDDHVSTAMESCLKRLMFAFVCDNFADADQLAKLVRSINFQHNPQPMILRRRFGARFNIGSQVTLQRYKSLLAYVSIENDQVFNTIMDKSNLEQTLYIPNDSTAVELLIDERNVPSNLKTAYSAAGTQFYPKRPGSNFRQYVNNRKASGILTSDTRLYIEKVETELADLNAAVQQLLTEKTELTGTIKTLNEELREFDKQIDKNLNRANDILKQIYELGSVKEFKPEDLSIFESDYQQCVDAIAKHQDDLRSLKDDMRDIESKFKINKNDQTLVDQDMVEKRERFEAIKKQVRENEFLLAKNLENIRKLEARIEEFNVRKEEQLQKLTSIVAKKEQAIENARAKSAEPVETDRTPEAVQKEVDDLNEFIRENENRLGDKEELLTAYKEKKTHFDRMNDQVEFLEKYINEFSDSIRKRAKIYCKLRDHITRQTSENFSKNLQLLKFTGKLRIYHRDTEVDGKMKKAQTLEISINPKSSDPTKMYKDTRSLSGGERSFSTIAFLIALWDSSYSPFNILDEVDVFMDRVTRSMALEALIENANRKQGKQYIFLSPLLPEKVSIQNLLKIFYMPEPHRCDAASP